MMLMIDSDNIEIFRWLHLQIVLKENKYDISFSFQSQIETDFINIFHSFHENLSGLRSLPQRANDIPDSR